MGQGSDRNRLCSCGSGKKAKRCHPGKQERAARLVLDFGKPVAVARVSLDPETTRARFFDDSGNELHPVAAELSATYERARADKGPKVLSRHEFDPVGPLLVNPIAALRAFDRVYSVDTNSRLTSHGQVSIGAVASIAMQPYDDQRSLVAHHVIGGFDVRGVPKDVNPELVCWKLLIQHIRYAPDYDPRWQIAIVVDSELGSLGTFNSRREQILGLTLPANFKLLYASADKPNDGVLNSAVAGCDEAARLIADAVGQGKIPPGLMRAGAGTSCSEYRMWRRLGRFERFRVEFVPASIRLTSQFIPH